jgi:NAD(P)-dependent dehydrogenase (short-subunit alcohol dehydrogenase family)
MTISLRFPEGSALVAGGTGNVGAGVTRRLAEAGLAVTFTYLGNATRAEAMADRLRKEGLRVRARQMDLRDARSIDAAIAYAEEQHGPLRTVACAAGARVPLDNIADFAIEDVERYLDADAMAYYRLVNRVVPVLRARGGGSITLATTIALSRAIAFDGISPFSKGAVEALVRQVAWEEAGHAIRCNAVPIGWVSPWDAGRVESYADALPEPTRTRLAALMAQLKDAMRIAGPARPEDAGDLFAFLASEQARFITGQSVALDGGATL